VVLVVDQEPVYRAGLECLLEGTGHVVEQAEPAACVQRAAQGDLAGLVLDARCGPGDYSVGLVSQVGQVAPGLPVTLVVARLQGPGLVAVLEAGVRALLHRSCSADELVAAVDAAAAGRNWVGRPLALPLQEELLAGADGSPIEPLTAREREVLARLAKGGTNAMIGHQLGISEHTVRNHMRSILAKLGVANRTDAVATAARRGLLDLS
jgi:DNA-binding NarL/FixJ family response regulator